MKTASSIKEIKQGLQNLSQPELKNIVAKLASFKKENKEYLTYLLFDSLDEEAFVSSIKREIDQDFDLHYTPNYYMAKKQVRKTLRMTKTYIRFSKNKQTEVELLLHFCHRLKRMSPRIHNCPVLENLLERQINSIRKTLLSLHEDLRYDYEQELEKI